MISFVQDTEYRKGCLPSLNAPSVVQKIHFNDDLLAGTQPNGTERKMRSSGDNPVMGQKFIEADGIQKEMFNN